MGRRLTALLSGRRKTDRAPVAALLALTRADVIWAAATALASAVLFATVLRSYPGLGDAAESVAGVSSLGILHAPGYPAYVIAAHIFTLVIPFGSEAFKVNLFSLVCASVSVGVVHLLARRCGAARWAASIGALALAATAGFGSTPASPNTTCSPGCCSCSGCMWRCRGTTSPPVGAS